MVAVQKRYTRELKSTAIRMVLEGGRPVAQVARYLGLPVSSLKPWVHQARAERDLDRLRAENRDLRLQNATLSKALFRAFG
jgi:transposase